MVVMEDVPRTMPRTNARIEMPESDMLPLGRKQGSRRGGGSWDLSDVVAVAVAAAEDIVPAAPVAELLPEFGGGALKSFI